MNVLHMLDLIGYRHFYNQSFHGDTKNVTGQQPLIAFGGLGSKNRQG